MAILEVKNLTHIFDDKTIGIKDINLKIEDKEFIVISGSNGSGKTVLIRHFNGLLLPTKGEVLFNGSNIKKNIMEVRKNIGLIFQDSDAQIVGQTVKEDIAFGPENLGIDRADIEKIVETSMDAMGLKKYENKDPHTLSGGQKKRLAIAGVLAMNSSILIFDEPFTGLDYLSIKSIIHEIVKLHKQNHTIIIVTHELEKILAHATRLIIMHDNKIVSDGAPSNVINDCEKYGLRMPIQKYESIEEMTWNK